ncbi:hypothetical protein PAXINDRAFT_22327 [Paxillus involutus ATCC 200175]|uniref:Unplaced genomic scaffold PAXINscaffold_2558, whole genome shotgun sequence n=1 Tax=Paxillus involutus ATCC 200175 TaxID=664439 RepID=A0A0C9TAS9_PAXIN|nr:hypothetical protein PAXINDRAFT_22327 [Paxillus involutus ATCC 200175]
MPRAKRGASDIEDATQAVRRSTRQKAGTGGAADQLEKIGNAITQAQSPRKKRTSVIPKDVPVNPLAPTGTKCGGKRSATFPAPSKKHGQSFSSAAPSSRFGFRAGVNPSKSMEQSDLNEPPPSQASKPPRRYRYMDRIDMPPSDDMDGIFQPSSGFHPPLDAFTRGMDIDDDEGMKMEEDGEEDGQDNDNNEEDGGRRRSTAWRMQEEDEEGVYENEDESNSGEDEEGVYENKNEDRSTSGEEEEEVEEEEEEVEGDDGSSDKDKDKDDGDEAEATSLRRAVVRGRSSSLTPPRRPRTNRGNIHRTFLYLCG